MQRKVAGAVAGVLFFLIQESLAADLSARCSEALKKGIEFLGQDQRVTGSFPTSEWRMRYPKKTRPIDTPFTVSQVLYSLTFCQDDPTGKRVRDQAAAYLVKEKEGPGFWRYQGRYDLVPPDMDDTAFAWAALKRNGDSIPPEALAAMRASRNEEGLINTWMGDPSTWEHIDSREIDAIVNLNSLLAFGLAGENMDKVCNYAVKMVESGDYRRGSVYYPSELAFTNAFSRAYSDGGVKCLQKAVNKIRDSVISLQQPDGGWGNDYETALGLLTLLNLGEKSGVAEKAAKRITEHQLPDGGWAFALAYTGAPRDGAGRYEYGSRAVTTALCVEALAKYIRR